MFEKQVLFCFFHIIFLTVIPTSHEFICRKDYDNNCSSVLCGETANAHYLICLPAKVSKYIYFRQNIEYNYRIEYSLYKYLKVECYGSAPYKFAMFSELDVAEIDYLIFVMCPLPNINFKDLFHGLTVKKLIFERRTRGSVFVSLFKDLTSLESLNLSWNEISFLPEGIFQNLINIKSLQISNNQFKTVPEDIFQPLSNLENLDLGSNKLARLPKYLFSNLSKLKRLYLYNNQLSFLPNDIFNNLNSLEVLELSGNHFTELPENIFSGLPKLRRLGLANNEFKTLPAGFFRENSALEELKLSGNPSFKHFPDGLLERLINLKNLSINDCNITRINVSFFSQVSSLVEIKMRNNRLTYLPIGTFQNNSNLRNLQMMFNDLISLPIGLFEKQFNLIKLNLFKNDIQKLEPGIFDMLMSVQEINLGYNYIKYINETVFKMLKNLKTLILTGNQITTLEKYNYLDNVINLKIIDLSKNNLTTFPDVSMVAATNVTLINLKYNHISHLEIPLLASYDVRIFLQGNQIRTVSVSNTQRCYKNNITLSSSVEHISGSRVFFLQKNLFQCDCCMLDFADHLTNSFHDCDFTANFHGSNELVCSGPPKLAKKPITSILRAEFTCVVENNCPTLCSCFLRASDNKVIVNCSGLYEDKLPLLFPENTSVLHFENNSLTSLSELSSEVHQTLTELYLDNNLISSIENWNFPPKLEVMSLRENYLNEFSIDMIKKVDKLSNFAFRLGNNPWNCDCQTVEFKSWLIEHLQNITDIDDIYCFAPITLNGTLKKIPLVEMPDNVLCPNNDWSQKNTLITVIIICVVLALLLLTISVLYYRNKQTVIAYFYVHFFEVFPSFFTLDELEENKLYDAFISYCSSDSDVAVNILKELETKEPYFKLCVHDRDWLAGNAISSNIIYSIQNSKRIILILSKDFVESAWFHIEFHAAHYQTLEDKVNRLIIVVTHNLPPKDSLDKDLQYLLSTKTYLLWKERWFWEKLRYAMPHRTSVQTIKNKRFYSNQSPSLILKTGRNSIEKYNDNRKKIKQNTFVSGRSESKNSEESTKKAQMLQTSI
uniref:Toll-like receptor n=1 Tax=Carcinoscorpius rotundicauda TaxID=6848 RepID=B3RH49_CARRO|nr:toll-like receptor [Carcinoscorpius rotundicauda]